ncbi:hypothetical protein, partial [Streptococcus suis]|uniref:hypothetical protein n=1 Tax=Streptococcus suis TaxID=1307 RepID=UPI001EE6C87F
MQTIDTTAFVYFPRKFHVRINVRFHSISANKKSPANAGEFCIYTLNKMLKVSRPLGVTRVCVPFQAVL